MSAVETPDVVDLLGAKPSIARRLAALPAHEALAVFGKLYEELLIDAHRLAARIEQFEGMERALAGALGRTRDAEAGEALSTADDPENRAYLAELVARVKGGEKDA
jgi:hypothetical protein